MREKNGNPALIYAVQLKEACKATRSRWAAWIRPGEASPAFLLPVNLSRTRQSILAEFTAQASTAAWLAGTLPSGRVRWRQMGTYAARLGCQRLYVFPNAQQHCALLVGADDLPKPTEGLFRVLALTPPPAQALSQAPAGSQAKDFLPQLDLLAEFASAASRGSDPHEAARQAVERTGAMFEAATGIFLLSPDGEGLRPVVVRPAGDQGRAPAIPGELRSWAARLMRLAKIGVEKGTPVRACEVGPSGPCASLAVPLKYQGVVTGALVLEASVPPGQSEYSLRDAFSSQDEQLLVIIAGHVAGLFENLRLQEEAHQRDRKLQDTARQLQVVRGTVLEFGRGQGDGRPVVVDFEALLERVLRRARELVGARGAELHVAAQGAPGLRLLARSLEPGQPGEPGARPMLEEASGRLARVGEAGAPPSFGEAQFAAQFAARVAAAGEPVMVNDLVSWVGGLPPGDEPASLDAGYGKKPSQGVRSPSIAGVPLRIPGPGYQPDQANGALLFMDDRPGKIFHPEDLQLLELLAPLVEVWVRNAWLLQELQGRTQAQQMAEDRLVRSARLAAVGEMAAGVAHELNNPLTTVAGFIELTLEELPKDTPFRPDLELALQEAHRARAVVRRILDFSRPAENQPIRSDLNELVSDVLTLVHHLVRTSGVEMHIELWHDLPWIIIDPGQIKQVLLNLVHNAIQAMPQGGTLTVKTAPAEGPAAPGARISGPPASGSIPGWIPGWLSVSIADSGVGISAPDLERIFEPFFTTRPAGQGTGLGLSVSYGIIAEHGGAIEVESQLGQGSCFTIYLPVEGPDAGGPEGNRMGDERPVGGEAPTRGS